MTIGATVKRMARQQFEVLQRTGFYDHGRYVQESGDPILARGNVQPSTPDDLKRLPEGSRVDGAITIWGAFRVDDGCELELENGGAPNAVADRLLYQGTMYEVAAIEHWARHRRYICSRAEQ